jgi:hypothetical protein
MTVVEYSRWKEGKKINILNKKHPKVIDFWKTNPTEQQEEYRSIVVRDALFCGIISGTLWATGISLFVIDLVLT